MSLSCREVDNIFQSIVIQVQDPPQMLNASMAAFKPEDPTRMEWRYELRGFVRGLTVTGQLNGNVLQQTDRLFQQPKDGQTRPGRIHLFSIEVFAHAPGKKGRIFQFDVAAMNPMDAYVQLTKRLVYRTIPDVYQVEVFESALADREAAQQPARLFGEDELIFVTDNGQTK